MDEPTNHLEDEIGGHGSKALAQLSRRDPDSTTPLFPRQCDGMDSELGSRQGKHLERQLLSG